MPERQAVRVAPDKAASICSELSDRGAKLGKAFQRQRRVGILNTHSASFFFGLTSSVRNSIALTFRHPLEVLLHCLPYGGVVYHVSVLFDPGTRFFC
jgi:hypothetical protein